MYDLRQALDIIHSGTWFSCAAVQADEKRAKAGKIIRLNRCKLARRESSNLPVPGTDALRLSHTKSAHHSLHFTRNLLTPGNQIVKIHPLLIFEINGKPVI